MIGNYRFTPNLQSTQHNKGSDTRGSDANPKDSLHPLTSNPVRGWRSGVQNPFEYFKRTPDRFSPEDQSREEGS